MKPQLFLTLAFAGLFSSSAIAGATASSFKKETRQGANYYNAQSALDGKMDTCWMLPGETKNVGEYIIIDVPRLDVDKIGMVVGFAKSEETFKDYPRVKTVTVEAMAFNDANELVPAGTPTDAAFEDKMGLQVIDISNIKAETEFGGKVKITIKEIFDEGADYPNLGISEVVVILSEFEAKGQVSEISSEAEGPRANLIDKNPKTLWVAPADGAMVTMTAKGLMMSSLRMTPGPKTHARPKKVSVTTDNRTLEFELEDTAGPHTLYVPPLVGYTGTWNPVEVKVLEVYPGQKFADKLAIADLTAWASSADGL